MDTREITLDFLGDEEYLTMTVSIPKYIRKIHEYKKKYPSLVEIRHTNEDGSMVVRLPIDWFKFPSPPRSSTKVLSEEEKEARRVRLQEARKNRFKGKNS